MRKPILPLCKAVNRAKLGINSRTKRDLEWDKQEREVQAVSFLYHLRQPTLARSGSEQAVAADEFPALSERGHERIS